MTVSEVDMESKPIPLAQHKRAEDPPYSTIMRALPLSWLLSMIAAFIGLAATVYFTQQEQGRSLMRLETEQTRQLANQALLIQTLTGEVKQIASATNANNFKDQEHDYKLGDLSRRVEVLERKSK